MLEEFNRKWDCLNMNIAQILHHVAPDEASVIAPNGLPSLPLKTEQDFEAFEIFLRNDLNFTATVSIFFLFLLLVTGLSNLPIVFC